MNLILVILVVAFVIFYFKKSANNRKLALENIAKGSEFLAANRKVDGVIETSSGLQYQILAKGDGEVKPSARSKVTVHYHGTLLDGSVFDSSVERNTEISFGLNQVIKGWTEGLQLMTVGDKFKFFIPADLAYGNNSAGKIKPGSTLVFEVELFAIN